jgi:hypothetical protein
LAKPFSDAELTATMIDLMAPAENPLRTKQTGAVPFSASADD